MRVIDRIEELKNLMNDLTEKYCENCQTYLCEECWAEVGEDFHYGERMEER